MPNEDPSKWLKLEVVAQDIFDVCNEKVSIENGWNKIYV